MHDTSTLTKGIEIIDLKSCSKERLDGAARVLHESFKDDWPDAWPTIDDAVDEVSECMGEDRIGYVALGTDGSVMGWVGAIRAYNGRVWELHPLCVDVTRRGHGIGRALIERLEQEVARLKGLTIYLGTDDENDLTSLAGQDMYADTWEQIKNIKNNGRHPFSFYEKLGFKIVGVVPDANGYGKPDIMMAKRVRSGSECCHQ